MTEIVVVVVCLGVAIVRTMMLRPVVMMLAVVMSMVVVVQSVGMDVRVLAPAVTVDHRARARRDDAGKEGGQRSQGDLNDAAPAGMHQ